MPASRPRAAYRRTTRYGNNGKNYPNWDRGGTMSDKIVIHVAQGSYSGMLG